MVFFNPSNNNNIAVKHAKLSNKYVFPFRKNISKYELKKKQILSCGFCDVADFYKVFVLDENDLQYGITYVESFIYSYYDMDDELNDEIVILTNIPWKLWNYKLKVFDKRQINNVSIELVLSDDTIMEINDCSVSNMAYQVCQIITIRCKILLNELLYNECYKVQVYENGDEPLLLYPIPVRHCEYQRMFNKENNIKLLPSSRKIIANCGFIYQKNMLFLIDWIEYYLLIGYDHLYIYVHIGVDTDYYDTSIFNMLESYVDEKFVTLIVWDSGSDRPDEWSPKVGEQRIALNDCIYKYGYKYKFISFFDDDEYLVPIKGSNIQPILNEIYEKDEGVYNYFVKSYIYGNKIKTNETDVLIEMYGEFDEILNHYRKSILMKPEICEHFDNHNCALQRFNGKIKPLYSDIVKFYDEELEVDGWKYLDHQNELHCAHYYYKKYHCKNEMNTTKVDKTEIDKFLPTLKEKISKRKSKINYIQYDLDPFRKCDTINDPRKYSEFHYPYKSKWWLIKHGKSGGW